MSSNDITYTMLCFQQHFVTLATFLNWNLLKKIRQTSKSILLLYCTCYCTCIAYILYNNIFSTIINQITKRKCIFGWFLFCLFEIYLVNWTKFWKIRKFVLNSNFFCWFNFEIVIRKIVLQLKKNTNIRVKFEILIFFWNKIESFNHQFTKFV